MANYRHPAPEAAGPDSCLILDQLCVWDRDFADCRIQYLGYPLLLSPAERCILLCLLSAMEAGRIGVDTDGLSAALPTPDTAATDAPPSAVSVYIRRINRKARDIGGRDLIVRDRHRGWRLNPRM